MRHARNLALSLAAAALAAGPAACASDSNGDPGGGGGGDGGGPGGGPDAASDPGPDVPDRVSDYVLHDEHTRLVIEVDFARGMAPRDAVEGDVRDGFQELLGKPDGVEVTRDQELEPRGSDPAWSPAELRELADSTYDLEVDSGTTKMHTVFVDGHSDQDSDQGVILGLQFDRHIILFKETIEDACTGSVLGPVLQERACRETERAIWAHEFGHAIGLVDNGLPMAQDHKDPEHGAHDESDDCIMYWAYQGGALGGRIRDRLTSGESVTLDFDEACLADVAALRD